MHTPEMERQLPKSESAELDRRRNRLNSQLLPLTALNTMILVMWGGLSMSGAADWRVVLGLSGLTVVTWLMLIVTLVRRLAIWFHHERI